MSRLLGIALLILGIYFLGQNIMFTTQYSRYFWRDVPAGDPRFSNYGWCHKPSVFLQRDRQFGLGFTGCWCRFGLFEWRRYFKTNQPVELQSCLCCLGGGVSADNAGETQVLGLIEETSLGNFPKIVRERDRSHK